MFNDFLETPAARAYCTAHPEELEKEIKTLVELKRKFAESKEDPEALTAKASDQTITSDSISPPETCPANCHLSSRMAAGGQDVGKAGQSSISIGQPENLGFVTESDKSVAHDPHLREKRVEAVQRGATELFSGRCKACDWSIAERIEQALGRKRPEAFFADIRAESAVLRGYGGVLALARQYANAPEANHLELSAEQRRPRTEAEKKQELIRAIDAEVALS